MTTQQIVKRIRGTTGQNGIVALPEGCFVVKTPIDGTVWVHDGATNGGFPIGTGSIVYDTVTTGITAAGTNQAGATALTTQQNYVSTGVNNVAGVVPATGLMAVGNHIYVANESATNTLVFYPPVGATINNQAANAPINIGANSTALFVVKSTTALRSVP